MTQYLKVRLYGLQKSEYTIRAGYFLLMQEMAHLRYVAKYILRIS